MLSLVHANSSTILQEVREGMMEARSKAASDKELSARGSEHIKKLEAIASIEDLKKKVAMV